VIWFLSDLARVARERAAIDELQAQAGAWLKNVNWKITPLLEADADIEVNGDLYPVTLQYPYVFPSCPPSVFPRGVDARWSYHQYGRGGELCLEWGADNWHPDITGADILASAYKLLSLENPSPNVEQETEVPSRDAPTFAQQLRGARSRFIATPPLTARLASLPFYPSAKLSVCVTGIRHCLAAVTQIEADGEPVWKDDSIPATALDGLVYNGAAIRIPADTPDLPFEGELAELSGALARLGIDLNALRGDTGAFFLLACTDGKAPTLVWLHSDSFTAFSTVHVNPDTGIRLAREYAGLGEKSACIVGCGSMGSKIATSLARTGVGHFELIDDDVFLLENLVRNDLDWRSLGSHKVDALSRRLKLVRADVTVVTHRVRLDGQESSTRIAKALRAVADCDVIIDATADAAVFNLLAGVATGQGKAMIWSEVFGGGIGGMMSRFSPGQTPTPARMRAMANHWCAEQGAPWVGRDHGYETRGDSGVVLIADDADVSVIAAHTARYALDHLIGREPRVYSHPVYLIGLKRDWLFKEPFDTYPIEVGPPEEVQPNAVLSPEQLADNATFLTGLIDGMIRADSTPD
jgi:ubiquitin-protein ligase